MKIGRKTGNLNLKEQGNQNGSVKFKSFSHVQRIGNEPQMRIQFAHELPTSRTDEKIC